MILERHFNIPPDPDRDIDYLQFTFELVKGKPTAVIRINRQIVWYSNKPNDEDDLSVFAHVEHS